MPGGTRLHRPGRPRRSAPTRCRPGRSTGSCGARPSSTTSSTRRAASPRPGLQASLPVARARSTALNVFAYDITTGNRVASFNHSLNAQGRVVTAAPDGSRIYVGGDFTAVDGVARGHVAAFDTATGALDPTFKPNVSSQVRALAAARNHVVHRRHLRIGERNRPEEPERSEHLDRVAAAVGSHGRQRRRLVDGPVARQDQVDRRRLLHHAQRPGGLRHGLAEREHRGESAVGGQPEDPGRRRRTGRSPACAPTARGSTARATPSAPERASRARSPPIPAPATSRS